MRSAKGAPTTIIHLVRSPVGGIFRHIADLAKEQTKRGHPVGVICDSSTVGPFEAGMIADLADSLELGIHLIPMPRSIGPRDLTAFLAVRRILGGLQPDVVHTHGSKGGLYGRLHSSLARRSTRPSVYYSPHGGSLHFNSNSTEGRLYFATERWLERQTDGLIHVSDYERRTYISKVGTPKCPNIVIHNGLRPNEFESITQRSDATDFVYVGMLRDLKGVDVLISAIAQLNESGNAASLTIVGDGAQADVERYHRLVRAAGLEGQVRFRAPIPAREAFQLGRCVVVPSRAESLPYLVLETCAASMPLIATNVGGIPEIFGDWTPHLVEPASSSALAQAMQRFLLQGAPAPGMEAGLHRRVRHGFSVESMADRVGEFYEQTRRMGFEATS